MIDKKLPFSTICIGVVRNSALDKSDFAWIVVVLGNPILEVIANFEEGKQFKLYVATVLRIDAFANKWKFSELIHHA